MTHYTLHCFAESGNSYKAALALNLMQQSWKPKKINFYQKETKTPQYLKLNEMGEAPVLESPSVTLSQTGVILHYLAEKTGQFAPKSENEKYEIMRWILFDNHKLTANIATYRFFTRFMKKEENDITKFLYARFTAALKILENRLKNHPWVAAQHPTIADISLCGYLFFDGEINTDWNHYPNTQKWLQNIKNLPHWQHAYDLMPHAYQE